METRKATTVVVCLTSLAGLAVMFLPAYGGDLEPDGPPAPTMKTLDEVEPRIPISQDDIPIVITQAGSYYLTEDVSSSAPTITIDVNDVTIDLMGFQLIGPGGAYGIYISNKTNIEVRNGTVRNYNRGLYSSSSTNKSIRVINVRAISNSYGIWLNGSGHLVKDCSAAKNTSYGIYVDPGSTVTNSVSCDNTGTGIGTDYGCTIIGNAAANNGGHGIYGGDGCTISRNTSYGNQDWGIRGGYGSSISGNTSRDNQSYGIYAANGSTVIGNTVYNNQNNGINASNGCTVSNNTSFGNQTNGITVSSGGSIIGNSVYNNENHGIDPGGNNLLDQNTSYYNNRSGGGYANIDTCGTCTITSSNHAP